MSEVSATEQAWLAQEARAMYVGPVFKLCNAATPSEFDSLLLSLFDSIEGNRDDIDAKIEGLRSFLKANCSVFERFKNRQKLDLVYQNMAAYLVRSRPGRSRLGMQQLLANWGKVGQLVPGSEGPRRVPETWIRPLMNDSGALLSTTGTETRMRPIVLSGNAQAVVGALFLSVTAIMVIYVVRPGLPLGTWLALGLGIFLSVLLAYKVPSLFGRHK